MNKGDITMSNSYVQPRPDQYGPYYEYVMSKELAKEILDNRGSKDRNMRPQDYLVMIVNEQFGIRGTCVHVALG